MATAPPAVGRGVGSRASGVVGKQFSFKDIPPIRADALTPDDQDSNRIAWVNFLWDSQDQSLRSRDRMIEENIRMLAGQQWTVFNNLLGRFVDVTRWMTDEEKRWRQRPVFNRLMLWFIITHARMTENPPIVTFVPGPDRIDAELAATMDIIWKTKWREVNMTDVWDRAASWLIPSGTVYLRSRLDLEKGPLESMVGRSAVPITGPDGNPLMEDDQFVMSDQEFDDVPLNEVGEPFGTDGPLAMLTPDGLMRNGAPFTGRKGDLTVDVFNALQVRGEWGPRPWHEKRWHAIRTFLTPQEIFERWGVDTVGEAETTADGTGALERLLFGKGFFGAADALFGSDFAGAQMPEQLVEVFEVWHRPLGIPGLELGMEESEEKPGGRLLLTTRTKVLTDDQRPVAFKYTSPIRCYDFVRIPGRPSGSTPQEAMNGPARAYNRGWAQILEHRNLVTNPMGVIDSQSGLEETEITNEPGVFHVASRLPNVPAIEWIAPPPLGQDVYQTQALLLNEIMDLGQITGTEGEAPTMDASGELVKELRFNSDRFLGPTMRRSVEEFGRLVEDWIALMPMIFDREQLLSYAGDDNVARTITVLPELFVEGKVNIVPDVESMLPEGRGQRQNQITSMYSNGLFGPVGSPVAVKRFFELSRFPHLDRAKKFGGIDRITAEQENGQLLQGTDPREIPVHEWYDDMIHLMVHEDFMKSPEFLKQKDQIQGAFEAHRQMHIMNIQMKAAESMGGTGGANDPAAGGGRGGGLTTNSSVRPEGTIERQPRGIEEAPTAAGQSVGV